MIVRLFLLVLAAMPLLAQPAPPPGKTEEPRGGRDIALPAQPDSDRPLGRRNPFAGQADAIEAGRGTFRIYCSPCHGIAGEGGRGPDLTTGSYAHGDRDEDLFAVISGGIAGTEMGDYGSRLGPDNVWRLVSFIRAISRTAPVNIEGHAPAGEQIFWGKGGCGSCHRVGTKGGRIGPDLTLAGRQRSLDYLKEAIVDPDARLTPGFNTITVVLPDGKTIRGVERNYDSFSAQFMDTAENLHSYWREDVKEMRREIKSMMPSYRSSLNERELNDLLAYVVSLRGEK